ncbi:hypothetical protein GCM10010385_23430 [Streptomyces geysiriensis]|nr:hypothetical protein GCM10010385_23430 [Streptomyces geysiriensis]
MIGKLVPRFQGGRERGSVGGGLGVTTSRCGLAHGKVREREKEQASHHGDVDGKSLPRVVEPAIERQPPVTSVILSVIAL